MPFLSLEVRRNADGGVELHQLESGEEPFRLQDVTSPHAPLSVQGANGPGPIETKRLTALSSGGWPETKTTMEERCIEYRIPTPFGDIKDRKCADVPVTYHRSCTKTAFLDVSYPASIRKDVEECLKGAAVVAAIAAYTATPAIGAASFKATLKACLAAKGTKWLEQVSASAGDTSECGDWHPV